MKRRTLRVFLISEVVAALPLAVLLQDVQLVPELVCGADEIVPPVGVARNYSQGAPLACAANHQDGRRVRARLAIGVLDAVVLALEVGGGILPHGFHNLHALFEHLHALPGGWVVEAVSGIFRLVPACAVAENEPSRTHPLEACRHLCHQGRLPEGVAHDDCAKLGAGVSGCYPCEVGPALHAELVIVGEVVGNPQGGEVLGCDVEGVVEVGQELAGAYDLEAPVAGRGMVAELHLWIGHSISILPHGRRCS